MKLSHIGIDLAKNVFQLHGVDGHGKAIFKRRLRHNQWLAVLLDNAEPGCEIGMEACTGAHHWARLLQAMGFTVVDHTTAPASRYLDNWHIVS